MLMYKFSTAKKSKKNKKIILSGYIFFFGDTQMAEKRVKIIKNKGNKIKKSYD